MNAQHNMQQFQPLCVILATMTHQQEVPPVSMVPLKVSSC